MTPPARDDVSVTTMSPACVVWQTPVVCAGSTARSAAWAGEAKVSWTLIGHHDRHATLADQLLADAAITVLVISR